MPSPALASSSPVLSLSAGQLRQLMPHRYPMALLDQIKALWPTERRVLALKLVSSSDPLVQGHFKGFPVFPPTLVIEALAQASGLLMNVTYLDQVLHLPPERIVSPEGLPPDVSVPLSVLAESKILQRRLVPAGSTIELESRLVLQRAQVCFFRVRATVDGQEVTHGEMLLAYPPYGQKRGVRQAGEA